MNKLEEATPKFAFILGLLLLGVFPTDIITSVAVGGCGAPFQGTGLDELEFVGHQRDRARVLHRHHH